MPLILAIETSGMRGSIALCRDDACLGEAMLKEAPRRHAQTLVSQIDEMLRRLDVRAADLNVVAVSIGPGSFTGLRVGGSCPRPLPMCFAAVWRRSTRTRPSRPTAPATLMPST